MGEREPEREVVSQTGQFRTPRSWTMQNYLLFRDIATDSSLLLLRYLKFSRDVLFQWVGCLILISTSSSGQYLVSIRCAT